MSCDVNLRFEERYRDEVAPFMAAFLQHILECEDCSREMQKMRDNMGLQMLMLSDGAFRDILQDTVDKNREGQEAEDDYEG